MSFSFLVFSHGFTCERYSNVYVYLLLLSVVSYLFFLLYTLALDCHKDISPIFFLYTFSSLSRFTVKKKNKRKEKSSLG